MQYLDALFLPIHVLSICIGEEKLSIRHPLKTTTVEKSETPIEGKLLAPTELAIVFESIHRNALLIAFQPLHTDYRGVHRAHTPVQNV